MDRCNIGKQLSTPTIGISGIIEGIYHLYFAGIILFSFSNYIFFYLHRVKISITYCITWCLKFIVINRSINASYSLVVLITLSSRKVSEFSGLSKRSLPSWCFEDHFVFVVIISIFGVFHVCNRIISTSMWHIIFFRLWSIYSFRIMTILYV